jgi:hypothetical protein
MPGLFAPHNEQRCDSGYPSNSFSSSATVASRARARQATVRASHVLEERPQHCLGVGAIADEKVQVTKAPRLHSHQRLSLPAQHLGGAASELRPRTGPARRGTRPLKNRVRDSSDAWLRSGGEGERSPLIDDNLGRSCPRILRSTCLSQITIPASA